MKLFIWKRVDNITDNYHPEAGVACIANSEERARQLIKEYAEEARAQYEGDCGKCGDVTFMCEVLCDEEKLFIFPDAGCC